MQRVFRNEGGLRNLQSLQHTGGMTLCFPRLIKLGANAVELCFSRWILIRHKEWILIQLLAIGIDYLQAYQSRSDRLHIPGLSRSGPSAGASCGSFKDLNAEASSLLQNNDCCAGTMSVFGNGCMASSKYAMPLTTNPLFSWALHMSWSSLRLTLSAESRMLGDWTSI